MKFFMSGLLLVGGLVLGGHSVLAQSTDDEPCLCGILEEGVCQSDCDESTNVNDDSPIEDSTTDDASDEEVCLHGIAAPGECLAE